MKYTIQDLINHVKKSFDSSEKQESKINQNILNIDGMSGVKTRHLYNNICSLTNANYLEVGSWKGSSFISAMYKNNINGIAIDNWSEFGGPRVEFLNNCNKYINDQNYKIIEKDCFNLNKNDINNFYEYADIYLYDGIHNYESHKNAITYMLPFLSKYFILLVDDWSLDSVNVKSGSLDGFIESKLIIHYKLEIEDDQTKGGIQGYWNGCGVFVCENPLFN